MRIERDPDSSSDEEEWASFARPKGWKDHQRQARVVEPK